MTASPSPSPSWNDSDFSDSELVVIATEDEVRATRLIPPQHQPLFDSRTTVSENNGGGMVSASYGNNVEDFSTEEHEERVVESFWNYLKNKNKQEGLIGVASPELPPPGAIPEQPVVQPATPATQPAPSAAAVTAAQEGASMDTEDPTVTVGVGSDSD